MAQSATTLDKQIFQGTAASSGGTFAASYAVPTDQVAYLTAHCIVSRASGGHTADCAALVATQVAVNKNGTTTAPAAISGSANPSNSATTTAVAAQAQASEYNASGAVTLTWSISSPSAVCTYTNVGNANGVNVTIVIDAILVGST